MTAKVAVLPHECAPDYDAMRASVIESYAPANASELMLVDQIVAGYWRTIRARRVETAMFDNQIRTRKRVNGIDPAPNPDFDDKACAVILQIESPESMRNYFRYDSSISRDYYRAIQTLERAQATRHRRQIRAEKCSKVVAATSLHSTGFVSHPTGPLLHRSVHGKLGPDSFPIRSGALAEGDRRASHAGENRHLC